MEIMLHIDKSLEENAGIYFDKSKKAKAKREGAKEALEESRKKLKKLEKQEAKKEQVAKKEPVVKKWYNKFRWFRTSDGYLAVGGRDATTNDIVVKKHTEPGDLVFHTDLSGSPFFILKARGGEDGKDVGEEGFSDRAKQEVAKATATFSKAWSRQLGSSEVYCVKHDQLKKELGLPKGTFMVYGKREYFTGEVELAVGKTADREIMAGPLSAIEVHCPQYLVIVQGDRKVSDVAKEFVKKFGSDLDTVIRVFPGGEFKVVKTEQPND